MICTLHQILFGSESEKNETNLAWGAYGGNVGAGILWGNLRDREYLEDIHIWEDNIKIDLKAVGMDRIDLAQDRDR